MIIQLLPALNVNVFDLALHIPYARVKLVNSLKNRISILDLRNQKLLLGFSKKKLTGYSQLETDLTPVELGQLLDTLPALYSDTLVLAFARAKILLPQFLSVLLDSPDFRLPQPVELKEQKEEKVETSRSRSLLTFFPKTLEKVKATRFFHPDQQLFTVAIRHLSLDQISGLLKKGADPNQTPKWNIPSLFYAIQKGSLPLVEALVTYNAHVNTVFHEDTPLLFAIKLNQLEIARFLLTKKARDSKALIYAAAFNDCELIHLLAEHTDVNAVDENENEINALMTAAFHGHFAILKYLLEKNAYPRFLTRDDKTELYWASKKGFYDSVELLLKEYGYFYANEETDNALIHALKCNQAAVVSVLLHYRGLSLRIMPSGDDLLSYAVAHNFPECVSVLLKNGFKVSKVDPFRLVDVAFQEGYLELVRMLSAEDPDVIRDHLMRTQRLGYKRLRFDEVQKNPAYAALFKNSYRQALALFIKTWRFPGKVTEKDRAFFTDRLRQPFQFIKEPRGFQADVYSKLIKSNQWLHLNFSEPEFLRTLYKTLRQTKINGDECYLAYLLYEAANLYKSQRLRQHAWDGKGPYSPEKIPYSSPEKLIYFNFRLASIPINERCYFSINCSRTVEFAFLTFALNAEKSMLIIHFQELLIAAITKMGISTDEKLSLVSLIHKVRKTQVLNPQLIKRLHYLIARAYEGIFYSIEYLKRTKDPLFHSAAFLGAIYLTTTEMPYIELSPDYDKKIPNSPLLCRIIPSIASFIALQEAMHGIKHTSDPWFTAGQFTTHLIRRLMESPQDFGLARQARPVEIAHPDLVGSQHPHGYRYVHNFEKTIHDFFHAWQCGVNTLKDFICYLVRLEESLKGYFMSESIWRLMDMDSNYGKAERLYYKNEMAWDGSWDNSKTVARLVLGKKTPEITIISDHILIFIIDMIKNKETWKRLTNKYPRENFAAKGFVLEGLIEMNGIMKIYKNKPALFYVLAYRLKTRVQAITSTPPYATPWFHPEAHCLLMKLSKNLPVLKEIFYWHRNKGVFFRTHLMEHSKRIALEELKPEAIVGLCEHALNQIKKASAGTARQALFTHELKLESDSGVCHPERVYMGEKRAELTSTPADANAVADVHGNERYRGYFKKTAR